MDISKSRPAFTATHFLQLTGTCHRRVSHVFSCTRISHRISHALRRSGFRLAIFKERRKFTSTQQAMEAHDEQDTFCDIDSTKLR